MQKAKFLSRQAYTVLLVTFITDVVIGQRDASQLYLEVPTLEGVAVLLWVVLAVGHVFCLCKMLMIQPEKLVYHGFESLLLWKEILTDS